MCGQSVKAADVVGELRGGEEMGSRNDDGRVGLGLGLVRLV